MSTSNFYDSVNKIWSGPTRPAIYNNNCNVGYLILNVLRSTPNKILQINADNGNRASCSEIYKKTLKIVKFLSAKGLKQNDVAGFLARNSENLICVIIACLTLGLPINPLATIMGVKEICYMYEKTRPKVIFCDGDLVGVVEEAKRKIGLECEILSFIEKVEGVESVDEIVEGEEVEDFNFPTLKNIDSTPALIACSSGTSDTVKGVLKTHKNIITNVVTPEPSPIDYEEIYFFPTQIYWATAIISMLLSILYGGSRIITIRDITPEWFEEICNKFQPTHVFFSPAVQYPMIRSEKVRPMESPRMVMVSGVAITEELMEKAKILFPNARINGCYGSTECEYIAFAWKPQRGVSSGNVVANYQVKIIDESGTKLGPNQQGEICVKPPTLFAGYFNDPEKSSKAVENGWIFTGDLGYFDDDGYIYIIDRIKHMLKSTTMHFTPLEIEKVINEIEGVETSAVVGVFHEGNDVVSAFVIKREGRDDINEEFVKNYVNSRVHEQKRIQGGVHFVERFPVTPTGKILKRELKDMAKKAYEKSKK